MLAWTDIAPKSPLKEHEKKPRRSRTASIFSRGAALIF
jgi:hypothetical protein